MKMSAFVPNKVYLRENFIPLLFSKLSGASKKFEDKKLEEILDEDRSQTLTELGKTLQVDESTVSKRLKVLGMIQKQGHWMPYELKPRDVETAFCHVRTTASTAEKKRFFGPYRPP